MEKSRGTPPARATTGMAAAASWPKDVATPHTAATGTANPMMSESRSCDTNAPSSSSCGGTLTITRSEPPRSANNGSLVWALAASTLTCAPCARSMRKSRSSYALRLDTQLGLVGDELREPPRDEPSHEAQRRHAADHGDEDPPRQVVRTVVAPLEPLLQHRPRDRDDRHPACLLYTSP